MWIFPAVSLVVSGACSGYVFRQYRQRGKSYQLVWAIALACFAIGSGAEFIASISGWSPLLIRLYYLFGATLVVGYLALGTVCLSASARTARIAAAVLVALTVVAVVAVAGAPIDTEALASGYRAMERPPLLRAIAMTLNIGGTLVVVGGALVSGWTFLVRRQRPERAAANALIALGVLVVASGGALTGVAGGDAAAITIANAVGILIMFAGVLLADRGRPPALRG